MLHRHLFWDAATNRACEPPYLEVAKAIYHSLHEPKFWRQGHFRTRPPLLPPPKSSRYCRLLPPPPPWTAVICPAHLHLAILGPTTLPAFHCRAGHRHGRAMRGRWGHLFADPPFPCLLRRPVSCVDRPCNFSVTRLQGVRLLVAR